MEYIESPSEEGYVIYRLPERRQFDPRVAITAFMITVFGMLLTAAVMLLGGR